MQADLILTISHGFGRDYNEGNPEELHGQYIYIIDGCSVDTTSLFFYAKLMVPKGFMSFRATLNHSKLVTEPKTTIPLEAGIVLSTHIAWGSHLL